MDSIEESLQRLDQYCRENKWAGWDPHDGLNSALYQALPFKRWRVCRLAWIQFIKRCPVNLRPLLGVPRSENPKALALAASGLVRLETAGCTWVNPGDTSDLFERLERLRSPGFEPWCWGYDFAWQNRAFFVPRFAPSSVVTVFAAHAFLDRYDAHGDERDLEKARSACAFVLKHLRRLHESPGKVCFSYTPFDKTAVHNIGFLIGALLARVSATTGDRSLADWARRTVDFPLSYQAADGSWDYGTTSFHGWIDHFHTCYNLLALDDCRRWLRTDAYDRAIERGLTFYLERLFRPDGLPRPDTRATYPIDVHAVAVALITLTRFADARPLCRHRREKIIEWTLHRMQDRRGFFYYQRRAHSTVRIPYMRWSQAWMFNALAQVLASDREKDRAAEKRS
jgi:hypothetical protein